MVIPLRYYIISGVCIWFIPSAYIIRVSALYLTYIGHCVQFCRLRIPYLFISYGYDMYCFILDLLYT